MVDMALNTPEVGTWSSEFHHFTFSFACNDKSAWYDRYSCTIQRVETFLKCAKPGTAFILTHYIVDQDEKVKGNEKKNKLKVGKGELPAQGMHSCNETFAINSFRFQIKNELQVLYWKTL